MAFKLTCDSCEFTGMMDKESQAYVGARDHEDLFPAHFVIITVE